ncbi:phage major capsid protein [Sinirhodobacter ferrireducens]|uniref:Phage major capsid protein n=1 Tax=Paenirhodobacter ferrireducens TaxID=1215032 RepID=A0A443L719_9RHOB|nr:phage major capsid protein [Sinirhodobacter ferrireducens]RWR44980.1 phage major capsid protein [Sinirhodobacter ferrireducens]
MDRIEIKADLSIDDAGAITGLAWPFGSPDRVGDVIEAGAFAKAAAPLPMLDSHDQKTVVGVWDEISETPEGLTVKGRLLIEDVQRAREVRALVQAGAMRGLSIGFRAAKALPRQKGGRTIEDLELLEISIVAVPAHPGAQITSAKDMTMAGENEDGIAALEAKMTEIEKKADTSALTARLDKIEAKMNRPGTETKPEATDEVKAFAAYLSTGTTEGKALTTAADTANHILAPEQVESEFIRNLVEFSPIRTIADVRSTTSAKVILPKRTGITNAVWVGETTARTGSEPTFDQADIEVKEIATYVDISLQMSEDSSNVLTEVNLALAEDFGQKESLAFVNGSTTLEPKGFMQDATIATTDNGSVSALDPDALIALMYALPATYRNAGTWVMNGNTLAVIRTLKDGDGRYLWQPSYQAGQPETILGRPVVEAVDMPDIAEDAQPIIYGDFMRGYRIYDRLSLAILADPYSVRVNGLVRYHARRRVGADVVRPAAFRKLVMAV